MPLWSHAGNRKPSQRYQFTMPFGCFADPFWILLWWLLAFLMPTLGTCVEKTKFFEARLQCSNSNITGIMFATDAGLGLVGRANLQRSLFIAIPKPSFSTVDFGPLTGTVSWPRAASLPNPPHLWAVTIQWSIWMPCLHTQNAVLYTTYRNTNRNQTSASFFKVTSFGPVISHLFRAEGTSIWRIKRSLWRSWWMKSVILFNAKL